jgi:hypothetical protein
MRLAAIPTNMGKNVVYAMKATFDVSPSPNHTRNIGRNASGGIGRTNSITGSSIKRTGADSATTTPSAPAARAARTKPSAIRREDTTTSRASEPSRATVAKTVTTSPGVGRSEPGTASRTRLPWAITTHNPKKARSATARIMRAPRTLRLSEPA